MQNSILHLKKFSIFNQFSFHHHFWRTFTYLECDTCLAVLSTGKTMIKFQGRELGLLSFEPNREVKIFSKDAGSNPNLWGVVVSLQIY